MSAKLYSYIKPKYHGSSPVERFGDLVFHLGPRVTKVRLTWRERLASFVYMFRTLSPTLAEYLWHEFRTGWRYQVGPPTS